MIIEEEYRLVKNLVNKVIHDVDDFYVISDNTLRMSISGDIFAVPLGVVDKSSNIEIYERGLSHFTNYKMYKRAFSYLYYKIAEKDVREALTAISKEQDEYRNSVINYLKNQLKM